ncbi:MAG: GNAT family N-acetyltransferase [Anaerolineales bacterium]
MRNKQEFLIRNVETTDVDNLILFFINAYGKLTIFQNVQFLQHYFSSRENGIEPMSECVIGLKPDGEIVSHYGGLIYEIKINNNSHPLIWGVNAYTLPEWRGKGINSVIVNHIIENSEINGVIGFSKKAALFYEKIGYNIFNFQKFSRYILVLDKGKTKITVAFIEQDTMRLNKLFERQSVKNSTSVIKQVIKLTADNIGEYELRLDEETAGITTSHRSLEFLKWRILENPFIKYKVFGYLIEGKLLTYIVLREEILSPIGYKVNRIVDLYGKREGISPLLDLTIRESIINKDIYIDFSMFGVIYKEELISSGFIKLENDDCCIFPQVTAPIENRHNNEYLGLFSKNHSDAIANLTKENVYFTRIDSDRDRLGRISQIEQR